MPRSSSERVAHKKAERNSTVNSRATWRCKLMSLRAKKRSQAQLVRKPMPCQVINDKSNFLMLLLFGAHMQGDQVHDNALVPRMKQVQLPWLKAKVVDEALVTAKVEAKVQPGMFDIFNLSWSCG